MIIQTVLVIDDLRSIDYCFSLNKVKRTDNMDVHLVLDAQSAISKFVDLCNSSKKIDIIMLDHDLGETTIIDFLNYLIFESVICENKIKDSISNCVFYLHTSNYSSRGNMISKIKAICLGYDIKGCVIRQDDLTLPPICL